MAACMFNTCCGCIELLSGCLVIGYLNLAGVIFGLVQMRLLIPYGRSVTSWNPKSPEDELAHTSAVVILVLGILALLLTIIKGAFVVALLYGLHKGKRGLVKAYLIFSVVFLVVVIIMASALLAYLFHPSTLTVVLVGLALNIYFLLVFRSYYYKMDTDGPVYSASAHPFRTDERSGVC